MIRSKPKTITEKVEAGKVMPVAEPEPPPNITDHDQEPAEATGGPVEPEHKQMSDADKEVDELFSE